MSMKSLRRMFARVAPAGMAGTVRAAAGRSESDAPRAAALAAAHAADHARDRKRARDECAWLDYGSRT
jgi:hypothetical protein